MGRAMARHRAGIPGTSTGHQRRPRPVTGRVSDGIAAPAAHAGDSPAVREQPYGGRRRCDSRQR